MVAANDFPPPRTLHPLHAVVLAGTIPLFVGALLGDLAYWKSHEVQWANFASWLIAGGLVFAGIALACALVRLLRSRRFAGLGLVYFLLLLVAWGLGFVNALVHARDAWAAMPAGLVLSLVVAVLVIAATWLGFAGYGRHAGGAP